MASYVQKGDIIDYTAASNIAAGDVVVIGTLVGVATQAIASGAVGAVTIDGVVDVPVATGATAAVGAEIKWYATSGVAHASTGVAMGYLVAARAELDTSVKVKLSH